MLDDFADLGLGGDEEAQAPMQAWTEKDKELLAPCQGLLKASKACLKRVTTAVKTKGKSECGESVAQLDDIGAKATSISPLVDEVVTSLYPPVTQCAVRQNVRYSFTRRAVHFEMQLLHISE